MKIIFVTLLRSKAQKQYPRILRMTILINYNFELSNEDYICDLAPEQGSEAISPHIADDLAPEQGSEAISPHIADDYFDKI